MIQRLSKPVLVSWNITYQCPHRCRHCYTDSGLKYSAPDLNQALRVVDTLAREGIRTICIGGGEPAIWEGTIPVVRRIVERGLHVFIGTSGIGITTEFLEQLPRDAPISLVFGLDGITPNTYGSMRGNGSNLGEALSSIALAAHYGIATLVDFTPTDVNVAESVKVAHVVRELGCGGVVFKRFVPLGRGQVHRGRLALDSRKHRDLLETWAELRCHYDDFVIECSDPLANTMPSVEPSVERGLMTGRCWLGLTPDGTILPSPMLPLTLGSIHQFSISKVWQESSLLRRLATPDSLQGPCRQCEHNAICGGSREYAFAVTGSPFASDSLCWKQP